jgi:hypothetical protein
VNLPWLVFQLALPPDFRTGTVARRGSQSFAQRVHGIDLKFVTRTSKSTDYICVPTFQLFSKKNFELPTSENLVF